MTPWLYLAVHDAACTIAAVIFVLTDHPGWAAVFMAFMAFTTIKDRKK